MTEELEQRLRCIEAAIREVRGQIIELRNDAEPEGVEAESPSCGEGGQKHWPHCRTYKALQADCKELHIAVHDIACEREEFSVRVEGLRTDVLIANRDRDVAQIELKKARDEMFTDIAWVRNFRRWVKSMPDQPK